MVDAVVVFAPSHRMSLNCSPGGFVAQQIDNGAIGKSFAIDLDYRGAFNRARLLLPLSSSWAHPLAIAVAELLAPALLAFPHPLPLGGPDRLNPPVHQPAAVEIIVLRVATYIM